MCLEADAGSAALIILKEKSLLDDALSAGKIAKPSTSLLLFLSEQTLEHIEHSRPILNLKSTSTIILNGQE